MYDIFRDQIKKIIFLKSWLLGSFLLSAGRGQSSEVCHIVESAAHHFTPGGLPSKVLSTERSGPNRLLVWVAKLS